MAIWETLPLTDEPPHIRDYAEICRAAEKVVYSTTLQDVSTPRTRLERDFDVDAVRRLKADDERDLSVGGPELAARAFRAGLVDELNLLLAPVIVGGGKRSLPNDVRLQLELLAEQRFGSGFVHFRYRTTT